MINVPIAECEGDLVLNPDELRKYFGVDPKRRGQLPQYLIAPRLRSLWKENCPKGFWWDITGIVKVYTPVAWVPVVHEISTIPYSVFKTQFKGTTTRLRMSKIYGEYEASFKLGAGIGIEGLKMELSNTTSVKARCELSTEQEERLKQEYEVGDEVVKKIAMGMSLRVKRVFERSVHLHLNYLCLPDSLTWDKGSWTWDELRVAPSSLHQVKHLQFHPITMEGNGHSSSLYLQTLPIFHDGKLEDLHLVVSCKGWKNWYVYNGGTRRKKWDDGRAQETLPAPKQPLVTWI